MTVKPPKSLSLLAHNARRSLTRTPSASPAPAPLSPDLSAGVGAKLMRTLDTLADTLEVQASRNAGEGRADPKLVKALKDASASWASLHAEMRAALQAMSDGDYVARLQALLDAATRAVDPQSVDPPSLPRSGLSSGSSVDINFSDSEIQVGHSPTSDQPLSFDEENDNE